MNCSDQSLLKDAGREDRRPRAFGEFFLLVGRKLGTGETCADASNSVMVGNTVFSNPVNLRQ